VIDLRLLGGVQVDPESRRLRRRRSDVAKCRRAERRAPAGDAGGTYDTTGVAGLTWAAGSAT